MRCYNVKDTSYFLYPIFDPPPPPQEIIPLHGIISVFRGATVYSIKLGL